MVLQQMSEGQILLMLRGRLLEQGILVQPRIMYALRPCQYFLEYFP